MDDALRKVEQALNLEKTVLEWLHVPFVTLVRLYWGWAFATNGWGKLHNIDEIARWFGEDLHIPMPLANAYAASLTELLGGIALLLGIGGRIFTIPLVVTMGVAYLTSDFGGLQSLWLSAEACKTSPTCVPFEDAAPFSYLMASLVVLLYGAGPLSVDGIVTWWWRRRTGAPAARTGIVLAMLGGCVTEDNAAEKVATAECRRERECDRGDFDATYSDPEQCVTERVDVYADWQACAIEVGCEYDPDEIERCLDTLDEEDCAAYAEGEHADECDEPYRCTGEQQWDWFFCVYG